MKVDQSLLIVNKSICKNIDLIESENVWIMAQNILNYLRPFVEIVSVKVCGETEYTNDIFKKKAFPYISWNHRYRFLYVFHQKLQISESHYVQDEENSQRLLIEYYTYLLKIKKLLKESYNMDVLENLDSLKIKEDPTFQEYYNKISEKIELAFWQKKIDSGFNSTYYIRKIKPFFVKNEIYYEIMFSNAQDSVSKFDRIIAFTKLEIIPNYAINFRATEETITINWKEIPILIILDYKISIRPCEFKNLAKIFWKKISLNRNSGEYIRLMELLTKRFFNLLEIVKFSDNDYNIFQRFMKDNVKKNDILWILDDCRNIIKNDMPWSNIVRYLLYNLHNKIIKQQIGVTENRSLSGLTLKYECIPFDQMPFCTSLYNHNPSLYDLLNCIDIKEREHEFLARSIKNKTDDGKLYIDISELSYFNNIENLIEKFNKSLYYTEKQQWRKLEIYQDKIYRSSNERDIVKIMEITKWLTEKSVINHYTEMVESWLETVKGQKEEVDDKNKADILKKLFSTSSVALIYWSAWTGKTTLIKHVSDLFKNYDKLFLANTNSALNNLRIRVNEEKSKFSTIASCKSCTCNILVIDECSTVSNSDMLDILSKVKFDLLLLVWDTYQIESINFWNWFNIMERYIPSNSFILTEPYRTKNSELLKLWKCVREIDKTKKWKNNVFERLLPYQKSFDNSIYDITSEDEIILCLNYDWLYWINNINKILQWNNPNKWILWGTHTYKIWDPILFNESWRFFPDIYNNLKWKIINIEINDEKIYFSVEVDTIITEFDLLFDKYPWLELLEEWNDWRTKIRFYVKKLDNEDDDEETNEYIVPFQIAYAISIHKAQWLEYDSVKIIISDEVDERITHNIFYTAITRARNKLAIYRWRETEKKILENMRKIDWTKDFNVLKNKFNL